MVLSLKIHTYTLREFKEVNTCTGQNYSMNITILKFFISHKRKKAKKWLQILWLGSIRTWNDIQA